MWRRSSMAWGVSASLFLHGAWIGTLGTARTAPPDARATAPAYDATFELTAPPTPSTPANAPRAEVLAGGPETESALDLETAPGRGGAGASSERATLLFSFVSPVTLQDTELNNLQTNQTQRIHTASTRATQEERRATPQAAEEVFLASGKQGHAERRKPSLRDAQAGTEARERAARAPRRAAHARGDEASHLAESALPEPQLATEGSARGILAGRGTRSATAARVALARPNVDRGPAATPAESLDEKLRDNHDAELLAAALQRSIVDASTQRALTRSPDLGGAGTGPGFSAEGLGRGAEALPYSPGPGEARALDTRDARYMRWFIEQKERVQSELTFPKPRALAKDQGISIYSIVVRRDGRLAQVPRLVRSSGYADFDEAAVIAIRRAVPFSPLPERLLPDASDVTLLIPVAFSNPMVQ